MRHFFAIAVIGLFACVPDGNSVSDAQVFVDISMSDLDSGFADAAATDAQVQPDILFDHSAVQDAHADHTAAPDLAVMDTAQVVDVASRDTHSADSTAPDIVISSDAAASDGAISDSFAYVDATDACVGCDQDNLTICNSNGSCDGDETCSTCPSECGVCDISRFGEQRAKFVDLTCTYNGDGLADSCASAAGQVGRFNELQTAIDSLRAGDTLYIHPGDYWRLGTITREFVGVYTLGGINSGTAQQPVILTARFVDNPPVIHSFDPSGHSDWSLPALSTHGEETVHHVIFDHLHIRGRVQLWSGHDNKMQFIECTHGWGACGDGNWACLRIDGCTDCVAHHNEVHSVAGEGSCEACSQGQACDNIDRGAGLKEFGSLNVIWEFNTVRGAEYYGYDHHRDSTGTIFRFNRIDNSGIRSGGRWQDAQVYGNIVHPLGNPEASCLETYDDLGSMRVSHNTMTGCDFCLRPSGAASTTVVNNICANVRGRNLVMPTGNSADHNVYSAGVRYSISTWDGPHFYDLDAWQQHTGYDQNSVELTCTFADAPGSDVDLDYDMHITSGACLSAGTDGVEVGAYGLTSCVGHLCR